MCSLAPHMASPRDTCEDATAKWGGCFGCFAFWQRWPSQPSQRRLLGYLKNPECKITRRCKRRAENGCMSWGSVRHGTKMRWNYCILTNRCLFVYPIFFFSWQQDLARKSWQIWDWKTMMSWRNVNLWKEELLNWRISDVPLNLLFILRTAFWCFLPPSTFHNFSQLPQKG